MRSLSRAAPRQATLGTARAFAVAAMLAMMGGGLGPSSAKAQGIGPCAACVASDGCDAIRQACVAECRARLFGIDPRRSQCIDRCAVAAHHCPRQARTACLSQHDCR